MDNNYENWIVPLDILPGVCYSDSMDFSKFIEFSHVIIKLYNIKRTENTLQEVCKCMNEYLDTKFGQKVFKKFLLCR